MTEEDITEKPSELDYWIEYIMKMSQGDFEVWEDTFDIMIADWELDVCWRLLREARRIADDLTHQVHIKYREGQIYLLQNEFGLAENALQKALERCNPNDDIIQYLILDDLGMIKRLQGNLPQAIQYHQRHLKLAQQKTNLWAQATANEQLALDYQEDNQLDLAKTYIERALLLRKTPEQYDELVIAGVQKVFGLILLEQNNLIDAKKQFEEALSIFEDNESTLDLLQTYGNLGNIAYRSGNMDKALAYYYQALELQSSLPNRFDRIGLLNNLGSVYLDKQNFEQAERFYQESYKLASDLDTNKGKQDALMNLAQLHIDQNHWQLAHTFTTMALSIAENNRDVEAISYLKDRLGQLDILIRLL